MGNTCCSDDTEHKSFDPSIRRIKDIDPATSKTDSIKFPYAKPPKRNPVVQKIDHESGVFKAKNPSSIPSGTLSEPRMLNNQGLIYDGEWFNGIPHGKGKLYYPDGSYYEGYFKKGRADEEGRFISPQGWIYEGQLQNQQAMGKGVLYHKELKYRFEGMWSGDLPNGYGRQEWQNKNITYEGDFLNGKKHGQGIYKTQDYEYNGNFSNNHFDSYGFISYKNGDKFQGNFEKGKRNGNGTYSWSDGSYYEGSYKHDKKQGMGKYKSPESIYWEGEWILGKREGVGKLTTTHKRYAGNWANGQFENPRGSNQRISNNHSNIFIDKTKSNISNKETSMMVIR